MYLFIGGPEFFIIAILVVMLFGADKIPEIERTLGKGIRQVKDATNSIKKDIMDSADRDGLDTKDITKEIDEVKKTIDEISGPIKRGLK